MEVLFLKTFNNSDTDKVGVALRTNGSAATALGSYGDSRIISEYVSGSTNGANNLQFWTHSGNGTVAQAIHIDWSQRVGIGTQIFDTKLDVNGAFFLRPISETFPAENGVGLRLRSELRIIVLVQSGQNTPSIVYYDFGDYLGLKHACRPLIDSSRKCRLVGSGSSS